MDTDEGLYAAWRDRKDEEALRLLVGRHWPAAVRLARAICPAAAEDVAQQALVRVLEAAQAGKRLDPFAGWLHVVVVREARNERRARERRVRREQASARREVTPMGPEVTVREHVERLPEKLRLPLVLHFAGGLTHAEVARALAAPVGTVSSWIKAGLERLRAELPGEARALAASPLLLARALGGDAGVPPAPPIGALVARAAASHAARAARLSTLAVRALVATGALLLVAVPVASLLAAPEEAPRAVAPVTTPAAGVASSATGSSSAPREDGSAALVAPPPGGPASVAAPASGARASTAAPTEAPGAAFVHVSGRIVDAAGRPVGGASVALSFEREEYRLPGAWRHEDREAAAWAGLHDVPFERQHEAAAARYYAHSVVDVAETVTDDAGRFTLGGLGPSEGRPLTLSAGAEVAGGRAVGWAWLEPRSDGRLDAGDVVVELPAETPVLVLAAGRPVEGALVTVEVRRDMSGAGHDVRLSSFTGRDGRATVRLTRHDRLSALRAVSVGLATAQVGELARADDGAVHLELGPEAALRGVLLDVRGRPVPDAAVAAQERLANDGRRLEDAWTKTDAEGRFVLGGLTPGATYRVSSDEPPGDEPPQWGAYEQTLVAPANELVLRTRAASRLDVEVALPEGFVATREWLASYTLTLAHGDGGVSFERDLVLSPDGRRARKSLKVWPGSYGVGARDVGPPDRPRLAPVTAGELIVAEGRWLSVELRPALGRTLSGRVVDALHAPAARAQLSLTSTGHGASLSLQTDEQGEFRYGGLPAEPFELRVGPRRGAEVTVLVPAGVVELPEVVLPR